MVRTHRRRDLPRSFRLWLVAGLVALQVATVGAILASSRYTSEQLLLSHTGDLLAGAADQSAIRTVGFLDPAARAARFVSQALDGSISDGSIDADRLERIFLDLMDANPEFDGIYFGGEDGSFVFVSRESARRGTAYRTKTIQVGSDGAMATMLTWRDGSHSSLASEPAPDDGYDPRARPWYRSAVLADAPVWTEPYVFFTSQRPGVTVAQAVRPGGELAGAVGVDIDLSELSGFLDSLEVGERGSSFILDQSSSLVAYAEDGSRTLPEAGPARAAFAAFVAAGEPAEGWATRFEHGGLHYQAVFRPFSIDQLNTWVIGVYAPEDDFLGDLRAQERTNVALAVGISLVLIVVGLWIARRVAAPVAELHGKVSTDHLTGLANRRYLLDTASQLATQAAVRDRPIAVAMVDADNFKGINDSYGHTVGDEILVALAGRLQRSIRSGDLLARYGGEEFTVVMPDTDLVAAFKIVDRLRTIVAETPIRTSAGPIAVTLSAGVAELSPEVPDFDSLLHEADQALYRAKDYGRNCVVAAGI